MPTTRNNVDLQGLFSCHPWVSAEPRWAQERIAVTVRSFLERPRVNSELPDELLARQFLATDLGAETTSFEEYLETHLRDLVDHSVNLSSPRCLGHMSGVMPEFIRSMSELVNGLNQNLVKREASRAFTLLERQTLAAMHRLAFRRSAAFYEEHMHDGDCALGIMASGGTIANITALWCARNACFPPEDGFGGVEQEGITAALQRHGYREAAIVASELIHYSVEKAACLLGLGRRGLIKVAVDEAGRLRIPELRRVLADCASRRCRVIALVGVAGTTDCGSIDPLEEIVEIGGREGLHVHVDAAWSGLLLLCERNRSKLAGIERADSISIDGHKQLYLPLGTSLLLLRDPRKAQLIAQEADYMLRRDSGDQGRFSLEGSRAGTALFLHAVLSVIGRQGFGRLAETNERRARELADLIRYAPDFELLCEPQTNIVLYRYLPSFFAGTSREDLSTADCEEINSFNERLQEAQYRQGRTYVSRTRLRFLPQACGTPLVSLRAVISNPLTGTDDLVAVLQDQREIAGELEKSHRWTARERAVV